MLIISLSAFSHVGNISEDSEILINYVIEKNLGKMQHDSKLLLTVM